MYSPFHRPARNAAIALAAITVAVTVSSCRRSEAQHAAARTLRVCADPNNLPFSNRAQQGFENRIADLLAKDLGARVEYTWWAQRRGFIRNTLNAESCDVVMGVPSSFDLALVSSPYYRSSYVFVSRRDSKLRIRSFDDPALRQHMTNAGMDPWLGTPEDMDKLMRTETSRYSKVIQSAGIKKNAL